MTIVDHKKYFLLNLLQSFQRHVSKLLYKPMFIDFKLSALKILTTWQLWTSQFFTSLILIFIQLNTVQKKTFCWCKWDVGYNEEKQASLGVLHLVRTNCKVMTSSSYRIVFLPTWTKETKACITPIRVASLSSLPYLHLIKQNWSLWLIVKVKC